MATLNQSQQGNAGKGKQKKIAPRVDLTAMVDLMFLLTTFFMLTTSLGSLNAADIAKPDQCLGCDMDYPASRTMTILLGKNNTAVTFLGLPSTAAMQVVSVGNVYKEISRCKQAVAKNKQKHMLVIIKPTSSAKFQDFVDVVDEMKIADVKSYTIDDQTISEVERNFLKSKGL